MNRIRVASFFAGAGGLDLGFEPASFQIAYATDIDDDCCRTLELNRGEVVDKDAVVVQGDIRAINYEDLPNKIDLVVGGPPCQSFSASGRRAGGAAGRLDDRGNLFEAYRDIIAHLSPKAFLFENVRGILATNKGKDWQAIVSAFQSIGYKINYRILDAADYGVPQHRERIFLVGHRMETDFLFPQPLFGPDSRDRRPHVSPKEAFEHLRVSNEEAPSLRFEGGKYSHLLPEIPDGQNYLFFTAKRGHPRPVFAYRSRFSDFLYKAHPDYPMKTIIASPGKYTGPLHWDSRYFSIPEYKAIQGFPQNYRFYGDRASIVRQIGNSVSPKIAKIMADAIANQIFGRSTSVEYLHSDDVLTFDQRKGAKAAKTRRYHASVSESDRDLFSITTAKKSFSFRTEPTQRPQGEHNTTCKAVQSKHELKIIEKSESDLSARLRIDFWQLPRRFEGKSSATLTVELYGGGPKSPQVIWNAVDEWVRHVSSFHSLFELYGHFTEPYPYFKVTKFEVFDDTPWLQFARTVSDQSKCSKYLEKSELLSQFGNLSGYKDFESLASALRGMRFDVRTRETNIAIPEGKYMMAYPFTLPESKQMNFSIRQPRGERASESYVTAKRMVV